MTKRYRLVVFDWEGTLTDTLGQILDVLKRESKAMGLGTMDEKVARNYIELGLVVSLKKLFPDANHATAERLLAKVQETLALRPSDVYLNPGAKEIVQQINQAGMDLAIATNKSQPSLQRALQLSGLNLYFSVTRSAGQVPAKPFPQMLEEIMELCAVTPEQTLMVGDSLSDIEMARYAGVDAIGVHFYHQEEQVKNMLEAGALDVFDDYQQLANFLGLDKAIVRHCE